MLPEIICTTEEPLKPEWESCQHVGSETLFNGEAYRCIYVEECEVSGHIMTRYRRVATAVEQ